jgi:hypothetical protein
MAAQDLTFESVDRHVQRLDLSQFRRGGRHHFSAAAVAASPGDVLAKVCSIYRAVRPILNLIAKVPLLPKKWRDAISTFVNLMDSLCP